MEELTIKENFEALVEKYMGEQSQVNFLERLLGSGDDLMKDHILIDVAMVLDGSEFDPFLIVENGDFEDVSLVRQLSNIIFSYCRDEDYSPEDILHEIKDTLDAAKEIKAAEQDPEKLEEEENPDE